MDFMSSIFEKFSKGEIFETEIQMHILLLEKAKISSEDREHKEEASSISGMEELALKSTKFYNDKKDLSPQANLSYIA